MSIALRLEYALAMEKPMRDSDGRLIRCSIGHITLPVLITFWGGPGYNVVLTYISHVYPTLWVGSSVSVHPLKVTAS